MNKLITSFETKQKSLNFQQERKLLEEIKEGIEVIKSESSSPEVKKKSHSWSLSWFNSSI